MSGEKGNPLPAAYEFRTYSNDKQLKRLYVRNIHGSGVRAYTNALSHCSKYVGARSQCVRKTKCKVQKHNDWSKWKLQLI